MPDDATTPPCSSAPTQAPPAASPPLLDSKEVLTPAFDPPDLFQRSARPGTRKVRGKQPLHGLQARRVPCRSSYAKVLSECPRKFLWQVRYGLRPKGYMPLALSVGTFYHHLMERAITHGGVEALQFGAALVEESDKMIRQDADDMGVLPNGNTVESALAMQEQAFSLARVVFEVSSERFLRAPFLIEKPWTPLYVESPMQVTVKGIGAPLRCKPDCVYRSPDGKSFLIVNHKTTGMQPAYLSVSWRWNLQVAIEHACVWALHPDAASVEYCHNVVRVPSIRFPTKANPTWDTYLSSCRDWYAREAERDPTKPPILQSLLRLPTAPWDREVRRRARVLSECCNGASLSLARYYRQESACAGKFCNSLCPYLALCSADPLDYDQIVQDRYVQHFREDDEDDELE